jgi:hypothetical protein
MNIINTLFLALIVIGLLTFSNQSVQSQTPSLKFLPTSSYIDLGVFHVVGAIQNTSPNVLRFVEVIGTFYDANGGVVAISDTYTYPADLAPGSRASFDLTVISASVPQISNYSLTGTYQRLD